MRETSTADRRAPSSEGIRKPRDTAASWTSWGRTRAEKPFAPRTSTSGSAAAAWTARDSTSGTVAAGTGEYPYIRTS